MTQQILLDLQQGLAVPAMDCVRIVKDAPGQSFECRVSKRTLQGGVSGGVDVVTLDNGATVIDVLPTRGMGISSVRCGDVHLQWDAPIIGPVHPRCVPLSEPSGLGWLDGFDEWLVRCGLESNGSPEFEPNGKLRYSLHGKIANTPAHFVAYDIDETKHELRLTGKVRESRMFFKSLELESTLSMPFGLPLWRIQDKITNLSANPGEFQLLYHINTGFPFAVPGCEITMPFRRLAPRTPQAAKEIGTWNQLGPETPGSEEIVYFCEPAADQDGRCHVMLSNVKKDRALHISFEASAFPYFALWKSRLARPDGYVCGLEPCVNFPNTKSFEKRHGRVVTLKPGESKTFGLHFTIFHDAMSVKNMSKYLAEIQQSVKSVVEDAPIPEWSE